MLHTIGIHSKIVSDGGMRTPTANNGTGEKKNITVSQLNVYWLVPPVSTTT